jgi:membrane fusion protein, multidrug efflux system
MKGSASRIVVSALAILIGLVALGAVPRLRQSAALHRAATSPVIPAVVVMTPSRAPATADFTLPGNIQAIQDVPIFARADGYLKRRFVDIGDRVRQGQVLAEIDTPELDQQVAQGRAALAQAQASLAQAQSALQQARATLQHSEATMRFDAITLARWRQLKSRELVAQQDVDNFQAASDGSRADVDAAKANIAALTASVNAAQANVSASDANLRRLMDLQSYQTLRAPYAGIVTVRNVDEGSLISAGRAQNTMPAFRVAQIDDLRVYVNVPQTFVASIRPGLSTDTTVREFPQRVFKASVFSTAEALDPSSRTLLTEIRMPNEGGVLRPGMYVDVRFHVVRSNPPFLLPSTAIIIRSGPPRVAVVDANGAVRLRQVELGRDFGSTIEVTSGLNEQDRLIAAPADNVQDGMTVRPAGGPVSSEPAQH